jgi:hypothetical protein
MPAGCPHDAEFGPLRTCERFLSTVLATEGNNHGDDWSRAYAGSSGAPAPLGCNSLPLRLARTTLREIARAGYEAPQAPTTPSPSFSPTPWCS